VTPVTFGSSREQFQLHVTGLFDDGSTIDLTANDAGTNYSLLSGSNTFVSVTASGLVEARGAGQDAIVIGYSGKVVQVPVTVTITNLPSHLTPLSNLTLAAGDAIDLPVAATDPDGSALQPSGASLPSYATLVDQGQGAGQLQMRPMAGDEGVYSLAVVVTDDGNPPYGDISAISVTVTPCMGVAPEEVAAITVDSARLSWPSVTGATSYDVVWGDLSSLASSGGDFAQATQGCVGNNIVTTSLLTADVPALEQGFWFLVRGVNCAGGGTYGSTGRDSGINSSANACP